MLADFCLWVFKFDFFVVALQVNTQLWSKKITKSPPPAHLPIMGLLVHIAMSTPITLDFLCAMSTENLLMVTVMRTTIALIFFGHDLSHTHTEKLRLE